MSEPLDTQVIFSDMQQHLSVDSLGYKADKQHPVTEFGEDRKAEIDTIFRQAKIQLDKLGGSKQAFQSSQSVSMPFRLENPLEDDSIPGTYSDKFRSFNGTCTLSPAPDYIDGGLFMASCSNHIFSQDPESPASVKDNTCQDTYIFKGKNDRLESVQLLTGCVNAYISASATE